MSYDELNKIYGDLRTLNFNASMSEPRISQIIKQVFAHYLGVSDIFIPDENVIQKCLQHKEKTEIKGWSYVSLYACNSDNQLELVHDFKTIKIPRDIYSSVPQELKSEIPEEIDCHDYELTSRIQLLLNAKPEYKGFAEKLYSLLNSYNFRQYHFDSITDNGYFIFYLGICFASSEFSYPKNIIPIKLGLSLHQDNIVELAIFDTESEYEKICFTLNSKNISLFELSISLNSEEKVKQYLDRLNKTNEIIENNIAKSIIDLIKSNTDYKDLYSYRSKEIDFYPNYKSGDCVTQEKKTVKYIQFNTSDIEKWNNLIISESFQKLAQLIPDEILDRIYLRYKWFMDKNYNYYYKQVNPNKNKDYLRLSGTTIHNPIYNNAPNSTYTKQHSAGNNDQANIANNSPAAKQTNKKSNFSLKVAIKKLAPSLFGSLIGAGIVLTVSKVDLILTYIKNFIK